MDLAISPLTAEPWPALEDLFGRAGASPSDGASLPRGPAWTGWPAAGTSGRWMTWRCGRSRAFTCGAHTAGRA